MNNKLGLGLACAVMIACAACGGSGGSGSASSTTPAATAPSITTQPADQTTAAGGTAVFTVAVTGTAPLSYQWEKGGSAISGATSQSYTTPALLAADNGTTFSVVVSNSAGSVTSNSAALTVTAATALTITTQPTALTVAVGNTATFSVVAAGSAPLSYQWQKNGTNISGATSSSYTSPPTTTADDGATFAVVVSNSAGSVASNAVTLTVGAATPSAPEITTQPAAQSVLAGSPATFTVIASGASISYQWLRNGADIVGATAASYTIPAAVNGDNGATFSVVASNTSGTAPSTAAKLTVIAVTPANGIDIVTFKYDSSRTGQNVNESLLTTSNVNRSTFGLLHVFATDGKVDAQPLYLSQLTMAGTAHNVLFIATEHGSVYAIDAATYAVLWRESLVPAGQSTSDDLGCDQISPEIGITATPVIDRAAGAHGTMYVMAMSKDAGGSYHQILHALDVTTGDETMTPKEVTATFTASNGSVTTFAPAQYEERTALLLSNGTLYTTWSSHCDNPPYGGWIITYAQSTLERSGVLNVGPSSAGTTGNTSESAGPGIWMSGSGPAVDAAGSVYLTTGNGPFDTTLNANGHPVNGNFGQSVLKLQSDASGLSILDYFALDNGQAESLADKDLGSGGGLLLPQMTDANDNAINLYVGAGKDGNIYIVDQAKLGGFNPAKNDIYQEVDGVLPGILLASPAFFNNRIYYGPRDHALESFTFNQARMSSSVSSRSTTVFSYPGTSPTVSANGASNGVVWSHETSSAGARLHAYTATNLATELYNSTQAAGGRDSFGTAGKFIVPVVTGGKVYVGTTSGVAIFGLLH